MKKLSVYLDTSVINFLYAEDAPDKKDITLRLWKDILDNNYEIYVSEIMFAEIQACSEPRRTQLLDKLNEIVYNEIEITDEILTLSDKYVAASIIPERFRDDAIHISAATVHGCSVIASWNFRHMVKLKTILGVNGVNKIEGYKEVQILSPESILIEEDDQA